MQKHLRCWKKYCNFVANQKHTVMTRNITIKNPSQKMIQVFDALREKKQQQVKKLSDKKQGTFTIVV